MKGKGITATERKNAGITAKERESNCKGGKKGEEIWLLKKDIW